MSDHTGESRSQNRIIYWVAWGLLAVFIVIGLFTFSSARESQEANEKADEFIAALEDAGAQRLPRRTRWCGYSVTTVARSATTRATRCARRRCTR